MLLLYTLQLHFNIKYIYLLIKVRKTSVSHVTQLLCYMANFDLFSGFYSYKKYLKKMLDK